jgi:hypothetical protein
MLHGVDRRSDDGWFSRLMDRIAADEHLSRAFVGVVTGIVIVVAIWIATGIFLPNR